ncbi:acyl-CoA dehydrogenase [Sphingomonas sp. SRS2]|nr:acyl-CoA dehydrogenase [Sphingomonas sp. SRS2]
MMTSPGEISTFRDEKVPALIQSLQQLRPMIAGHAAAAEAQRSPVAQVADALNDLGIFTLLMPERWGGAGLSTSGFAKVEIELAKADPAMAWVAQILNGTTWIATTASDALQEALFADGPALICGAYNPPGIARKVDGGYIVSGRWPYSSGSRQAAWAQCGCVLTDTGQPVTPGINMAYIPMDQITIEDSWFVTGLQGTGSDTTVAKDVFVPDHRMVTMERTFGHVEDGKRHVGAPSDRFALVPLVRATGLAQFVGAAEAMLEIVEADSKLKPIVTTTYKHRTDSSVVVHDLGRVAAQLDNARLLLFQVTGQLDEAALAGRPLAPLERAQHKALCAQATELIHAVIEKLMFIAGSSAFSLASPLQRYWRDVHVGLRHIANLPSLGYEVYGRDRLALSPNIIPVGAY